MHLLQVLIRKECFKGTHVEDTKEGKACSTEDAAGAPPCGLATQQPSTDKAASDACPAASSASSWQSERG